MAIRPPTNGGAASWGSITGTLSSQVDLTNVLSSVSSGIVSVGIVALDAVQSVGLLGTGTSSFLSIANSPITSSGNFTLTFVSGPAGTVLGNTGSWVSVSSPSNGGSINKNFYYTDFNERAGPYGVIWVGTGLGSGTLPTSPLNLANTPLTRHRGLLGISRSTGTANSGGVVLSNEQTGPLRGGETTNLIMYPEFLTSVQGFFGFLDNTTATQPTDGVYFKINPQGELQGVNSNGGTRTSSGALLTLSTSVWYQLHVAISPTSASSSTFKVLDMDSSTLASATLLTNLPTSADRSFGCGINVYRETSGAGAARMVTLDYLDVTYPTLTSARGTITVT